MTEAVFEARTKFASIVGAPELLELDRAALLIAAEEYPELPVDSYLVELDALAEQVRARIHGDAGPHETLNHLRAVLADQEGFTGNTDEYYDPRNSYLNEVIDRRMGIPIALSTVYMEVARRIGFSLTGVGFPGHFLVKHEAPAGDIVVDPFNGGTIVESDELAERLHQQFGGRVQPSPNLLAPTTTRQLLFRMLGNLKAIYVNEGDCRRALAAVERMLLLDPDEPRESRDRGVLLTRVGRPLEALHALSRYIEQFPTAADVSDVKLMIDRLRVTIGMDN